MKDIRLPLTLTSDILLPYTETYSHTAHFIAIFWSPYAIIKSDFPFIMARTDESSAIEPRVVLRTPGMNEVLPRHDLNFLTSSATFPQGEWVLSEFGHPHQFQAAYCVRNAQGQMVRAPMPLANVSAVTNQQEIYDHCTVYHYDPSESALLWERTKLTQVSISEPR